MSSSATTSHHPFEHIRRKLSVAPEGGSVDYFSIPDLADARYDRLPYSIRVLLESAIRNCDEFAISKKDVENILHWEVTSHSDMEIPFKPARVILQDFTGVPAVVDFAAMRDAMKRLNGDPEKINPLVPVDLVIDHSVQVDFYDSADALEKNMDKEYERNYERFLFLKWGAKALKNMLIVPPGSGIVHQVNLEYLARAVFSDNGHGYPDSVVGTDSHTPMVNGLGIVGWGVGGIEAEAVMLGQAISMVLPQVVGFKLTGKLNELSTATDLVLIVVKMLRQKGVVGKFVEFYGPGVASLSIADRATIANMSPEYGATMGYFPPDANSIDYLRQTGRSKAKLDYVEAYLKAQHMFRDYASGADPVFTDTLELDLATVRPCLAGPKRPHDYVALNEMKADFNKCLTTKAGFKGFGIAANKLDTKATFEFRGEKCTIGHGSVVIAAITSCTNTSNPYVMLGAGLLAKRAVEAGLSVPKFVKTSLSPGSGVVTRYLTESGLQPFLDKLGFSLVGYGCMTCIGNSGSLPEPVAEAIESNDLVGAAVLSGNRNFEGRVNPLTRANYLASPPLCVAYAIAGTVNIDFEKEPIGTNASTGKEVFLRDIWPPQSEIQTFVDKFVQPSMFEETYAKITAGNVQWSKLSPTEGRLYNWDAKSTYIRCPPFFESVKGAELVPHKKIENAFCLLNLGDFITTDHISPAGDIARNSCAARYLAEKGVNVRDFNSYGARRGNDEVMARGTFANIRLVNKFLEQPGPKTLHVPTGDILDVFDVAERYKADHEQLIILAGAEYGSGSSRDWGAKGPYLLGVSAVIAVSYERIHRSNLVGMGIVPLQFMPGETAESLGLTGKERFTLDIPENLTPGEVVSVKTSDGKEFKAKLRFDTEIELTYYKNGGILQYMLRKLLK